ncbi:MAG: putative zinc-binding metallopeptidase [Gammaproteobacteria bacterium]
MPRRSNKQPRWVSFRDEELLAMKFAGLKLRLEETPLFNRVHQLYDELEDRGLRFRPHCWLAEEWFSPDGIPGIAIPFYLAHPRLAKLEARQMYEVEGGNERWCMKLLRHEAGHAICTAYQLHRRKRWKQVFGEYSRLYPTHYTPRPKSRNYVLHLEWWYAQSHPAEDFAETFAVWLKSGSKWRQQYRGWPALRKLEYTDELMESIAGKPALIRTRKQVEPISRIDKTLEEHYREKRQHYGIEVPEVYDGELLRLFPQNGANGRQRSAAAFLKRKAPELCRRCARGTGEYPYVIMQLVQDMIVRCREMNLKVTRPEEEVETEVAIFITVQTINYLHRIHHRVPV